MTVAAVAPVYVGQTPFPLKAGGPHPELTLPLPPSSGKPAFRLLDGPPYANGALHLGHVLNKALKDLSARAHAAAGRAVDWTPRWDCHGLPVELQVEQAGHDRRDPTAFVAAARAYAQGQVDRQRATFQTLGLAADWTSPVPTMAPAQQAATLTVLANLVEQGRLDVRHRPTPWCPACRSTVAGAEQESRSMQRTSAVVPFFLDDGDVLLSWTTTPWTLPYHAGLVLHPQARYRALDLAGQRAWVAEAAWEQVQAWYPAANATDAVRVGAELAGRAYRTAWGTSHTVVTDARVVPAAGTGCLHAVPAFDPFDADLGRTHGWPVVTVLGDDGRLAETAWTGHAGLKAGEPASAAVLAFLAAQPAVAPWLVPLVETVDVAVCWRHKAPLVMRPSRQVFLVLDDAVRARAMGLLDTVVFEPPVAKERLRALMVTRPDWCLSRQRTWGVPLALMLDRTTGQPHAQAAAVMRRVAATVAHDGVEAWWRTPTATWTAGLVDEATVERVDDVLDVWFDSGAVGVHQGAPADLVVEGHDQLRGWFQACLWVAAALDRPAPFARVVTHGFVVDVHGRKKSKSEGGDGPAKAGEAALWSTLPADVVRVWAALGDVGADRPWSPATVTAAEQAYSKFRGTLRFALANVPAADWARPLPDPQAWPVLDRLAWQEADGVRATVLAALQDGHYDTGVRAALGWVMQGVSRDLYGRLKDRLYCAPEVSPARQQAVDALRAVATVLVAVLAVLTPQLVAEAQGVVPTLVHATWAPSRAVVTADEAAWAQTLATAREALTAAWEPKAAQWKGGMDRARLVVPTRPTGVDWVLEEALGVGQVRAGHVPPEGSPEAVRVMTPWGPAFLAPSPDPLCPRCRRPGLLANGTGVCGPCARVAQGALDWRAAAGLDGAGVPAGPSDGAG